MSLVLLLFLALALGGSDRAEPRPRPGPRPDPEPEPDPEPAPDPGPAPPPPPEPVPGAEPLWILPGNTKAVRPWSFKQRRPFSGGPAKKHHRGIDVDADLLDAVVMPEDGKIVKRQGWVGPLTRGIRVQLFSGPLIVFGGLHPDHSPPVDTVLKRGDLVGRIGKYPGGSTMLHFEQWHAGAERTPWLWGEPRPAELVDPTQYMKSMLR